jgi:hypothetical protein
MRHALLRPFAGALAAAALLAAVPAPAASAAIDGPPFRTYLGVMLKEGPGPGVSVVSVSPGSPAERHDLKPGDRILSVNGRSVTYATAASLIATYPPKDTIELTLDRQGTRLVRRVVLSGWLRYEPSAGMKAFTVPGLDDGEEEASPDPLAALDGFNVLGRVLVDPRTGDIEFLGTYDARFATGAIPYRRLLEEAVLSPEPAFSLDPTPQGLADYAAAVAKKKDDLEELYSFGSSPGELQSAKLADWIRNWLSEIETNPLLEPDRQAFLRRYAKACGLEPAELATLFNYNRLFGAVNPVPSEVLAIQMKLLGNLGYGPEARIYGLYLEGSAESLWEALRALGKEAEARTALARPAAVAGKTVPSPDLLKALVSSELLRVISRSRRGGQRSWDEFLAGKKDLTTLDRELQWAIWPEYDRNGKGLIFQALGGLPLSNELIRIVYGVFPGRVKLRFEELPPASELARVLYASDYALKTIDMTEDLSPSVAGHRSMFDLAADFAVDRNIHQIVTLVPREVPLFVSDTKTEIVFGEARIGLDDRVGSIAGEPPLSPESLAAAKARSRAWAGQIVANYDGYAAAHPALHELREAAKVLALARWLREEKIGIRTGAAPSPAWEPPAEVPGLYDVRLAFKPAASAGGPPRYVLNMPMTLKGGVNFRGGSGWTVRGPRPPSYVPIEEQLTTSAALGVSAVQAALAGDLERARELAELGARALTGDLGPARVPPGTVAAAAGARALATPEEARLVGGSLRALRTLTGAGERTSGGASDADKALLTDIGEAFRRGRTDPAFASSFLERLRTREGGPRSAAGAPPAAPAPAGDAALPAFDCASFLRELEDAPAGAGGPKAIVGSRLAEAQARLQTVQDSLEELGRLRQGDLEALQACERRVSAAYEEARDRALDAAAMLLVDAPLEILQARREAMKEGLERGLRSVLGERSGALDRAAVAALDRQAYDHFRLKYVLENIYGRTERLHKTLTGAKSLADMAAWSEPDRDDYGKLKDGTLQLVEMLLGDESTGGALKLGRLTGKAALRFLSLYKAVDAAMGFVGDIVAQKLAWEPLVDRLVASLETNRRAVKALQEKARDLRIRIDCLRTWAR